MGAVGWTALLPRWLAPAPSARNRSRGASAGAALAWQVGGADRTRLLAAFGAQSVTKHALTEGDRLLLTAVATRGDRGDYAVVQNYGSLAARLLLQPMEEAMRLRVGRGGAGAPSPLAAALPIALATCCLVSHIGLLFCVFGPPFVSLATRLLLGARWAGTSVPLGLAAYAMYLLPMSVNGVSEALLAAAGDPSTVASYNWFLGAMFPVYAVLATALVPTHGVVGLVAALALSMCCRIAAVVWLLVRRVGLSPAALLPALPSARLAGVAGVVAGVLHWSAAAVGEGGGAAAVLHVGVGVGCAVVLGGSAWVFDRARLVGAWRIVFNKQS